MTMRQVKDPDGRVWKCRPEGEEVPGRDVKLVCTTTACCTPVVVKVSWQWAKMAEKGLARMILAAVR